MDLCGDYVFGPEWRKLCQRHHFESLSLRVNQVACTNFAKI